MTTDLNTSDGERLTRRRTPYRGSGAPATRNADDAIFRNGGSNSSTKVTRDAVGGYVAAITMGVHRA